MEVLGLALIEPRELLKTSRMADKKSYLVLPALEKGLTSQVPKVEQLERMSTEKILIRRLTNWLGQVQVASQNEVSIKRALLSNQVKIPKIRGH